MSKIKKFEVAVSSSGLTFKTDPNIPDDVVKLGQFFKDNHEQLKALVPNTPVVVSAPNHHTQHTATFSDIIKKYELRKKKELAEKTVYQYVRTFLKFLEWAEMRDGYKPLLMSHIDKKFISLYIEYLQKNDIANKTIEENHLKPLNTFFSFATSIGEFPEITEPSKNHRLATDKQTKIKKEVRDMFRDDDLNKIFSAENYNKITHPDMFWLPILGLYTGARMNELCTLATIDINKHDRECYTITITPDNGSLKTESSKRRIPLHKNIIEMGFLDYVEDVKRWGVMLFPNLQPDTFGSYIKEPSRRFGKYLDDIGISERTKVFHSFRATVATVLANRTIVIDGKDKRANENFRKYFLGHEIEDTQFNHYIKELEPFVVRDEVITYLDYDNVILNVKYKKGQFNKFLATRMKQIKVRAQKSKEVSEN